MNVTHDNFNRFFKRVCIVSVQLLQTRNSNMIAMIISYIYRALEQRRRIANTLIATEKEHSQYPHLVLYIDCYYEYNTHS
jgi:hypothetical protein